MTDFDRYANSYSSDIEKSIGVFGQRHDFFVRNKAVALLDILSESGSASNMRLLDVGCGTGLVHTYLIEHVAELCGVDISGESLSCAEKCNPRVRYSPYDGNTLPFADGSFDCAFAICVLHHVPVPQWQNFLREMARVVRKDGIVVVIEHNPLNPATQWVVRNCDLDDDAVLLWPRRLQHLFEAAALEAVATRHIQFTPFAGQWFRKLDGWLAGIPLGTQYVMHGHKRD